MLWAWMLLFAVLSTSHAHSVLASAANARANGQASESGGLNAAIKALAQASSSGTAVVATVIAQAANAGGSQAYAMVYAMVQAISDGGRDASAAAAGLVSALACHPKSVAPMIAESHALATAERKGVAFAVAMAKAKVAAKGKGCGPSSAGTFDSSQHSAGVSKPKGNTARSTTAISNPLAIDSESVGATDRAPATDTSKMLSNAAVKTWLFPVLRYGPNNEKAFLRATLGVAKEMGYGVVLTGLFKHYLDMDKAKAQSKLARDHLADSSATQAPASEGDGRPKCFYQGDPHSHKEDLVGFMPMEQVIDRASLAEFVPVISVEELRQDGWDGQIDGLFYGQEKKNNWDAWDAAWNKYTKRTLLALNVTVLPDAPRITTHSITLKCDQQEIASLQHQMQGLRVVGFLSVSAGRNDLDVRVQATLDEPATTGNGSCWHTAWQANVQLQSAAWIKDLAAQYAKQHLGADPYLAVHVRPYPDECLEEWMLPEMRQSVLDSDCEPNHNTLHLRLGPIVQKALEGTGLKKVVMLSHPDIRTRITELLGKVGVTPTYMDRQAVDTITPCRDNSNTFMGMVEEQVAVLAQDFIGTATSSFTDTIVLERLREGRHAGLGYLDEFEVRPPPLTAQ